VSSRLTVHALPGHPLLRHCVPQWESPVFVADRIPS